MCYNFEVSIISWFSCLLLSFAIFYFSSYLNFIDRLKYVWFGCFILTFTQIQVIEAIIWATKSHYINNLATQMIFYALWCQPLINMIGLLINKSNIKNANKSELLLYRLCVIYYLFIMLYATFFMDTQYFESTIGTNGHLVWNKCMGRDFCDYFLSVIDTEIYSINAFIGFTYLFGLIVPPALSFTLEGYITTFYTCLSFTATKMLYSPEEYASMWCFSAIGYSLTCLSITYIEFTHLRPIKNL